MTYTVDLDDDQSKDIDNEIVEACLISIENLVRKCSNEARGSIKSIFKLTTERMTYDPNYNYSEEDDE